MELRSKERNHIQRHVHEEQCHEFSKVVVDKENKTNGNEQISKALVTQQNIKYIYQINSSVNGVLFL